MLSKIFSAAVFGVNAFIIDVEVDLSSGLPAYITVGLPDTAVKESRERVLAAIKNTGFKFPNKRITVNLAPADIKKEGSFLDLPIAIGILSASGIIPEEKARKFVLLGELSLDGKVKPVRGVLPIASSAKEKGFDSMIVPSENAQEAAAVEGVNIFPVDNLIQAIEFLNGTLTITPVSTDIQKLFQEQEPSTLDFADVKGHFHAKRAVEVAAAGGHNIIMMGPPGSGKSMLAKRIPTILPPLTIEEALETTKIHSVAGILNGNSSLLINRPFRSPHHTISDAGLVGGGQFPMPGEISLAHNGVLFLDELPEFHRNVLEVLRQPLEDGQVTISRVSGTLTFPARLMLAAALNPCPCGNRWSTKECLCTPKQVHRYISKISGPLLDRIDIQIEVPAIKYSEIAGVKQGESSATIRERIKNAREIQWQRFKKSNVFSNAHMNHKQIKNHCVLNDESKKLLEDAIDGMGLSARAYDRILKVARTITDIAGEQDIGTEAVSEAIQYRSLDRMDGFN